MRIGASSHLLVLATVLSLAAAAACTKPDSTSNTEPTQVPSASAAPITSKAAEPMVSASAPATASAAPEGSATATGTAATAPATSGKTATAPSASGSAGPPECGTKPLPDCPLQAWMKSNANPPVMTSDLAGLATALDKIAAFAPPNYDKWASIAKDGAKAARANDLTAAKAACRSCHDQYKQKYKTEMRARKI